MNPLQNPSIELFGLRVDEPVTMVTDVMVATIGIIGYLKLASVGNSRHVSLYSYFFLGMGFSTLIAGIVGHGFFYRCGADGKMYGWVFGIIGTGFAQFAVLYHVRESLNKIIFQALLVICWIEVVIAMLILFSFRNFVVVEIHAAFGLVGMVTVLEAINYYKTKSKLSLSMIYGVGLVTIAILFHTTKVSISKWFNYMDISHVLMGLAVYIMIKGVLVEKKLNLEAA